MSHDNEMHEISPEALNRIGLGEQFSRRDFLLISGVMVVAVSALKAWGANESTPHHYGSGKRPRNSRSDEVRGLSAVRTGMHRI